MKKSVIKNLVFTGLLVMFSGICSQGFSQKKSSESLPGDGLKLQYNYPSDKSIGYLVTNKITQVMDIEGQSMQVDVNSIFGCSVKNAGTQEKNLKLEITIDTLAQAVDSPYGSTGGSISEVKGKMFNLIMTPEGKEADISEASKIVYNVEGSGETNVSQTFLDFFPDVPAGVIKPGDTWNSTDSVSSETPVLSRVFNSVNKFEGMETVNDVECARITSEFTGSWLMTSQNQGMDILIKGPIKGTGTLFFAVKEGYFIKQTVITKMTGTIELTGPQNMTLPIVMDINSVNEVKK